MLQNTNIVSSADLLARLLAMHWTFLEVTTQHHVDGTSSSLHGE